VFLAFFNFFFYSIDRGAMDRAKEWVRGMNGQRDRPGRRAGRLAPHCPSSCTRGIKQGRNVFGGTPNTASETLALLFASAFCLHNSHFASIMAQGAKSVQLMVSRIFSTQKPCKHGSKEACEGHLSNMFY
jgi:hypothetical protein